MNIKELVEKFKADENFEVSEPCGQPVISQNHTLPKDVEEFYTLCGGIEFNGYSLDDEDEEEYEEEGSAFPMNVLSPNKVTLANKALYCEIDEYDITDDWYLIIDAYDGNYISIDFSSERNGRCYVSFFDTHGVIGSCPIVSMTFTEFLENMLNYKGQECFFWEDDGFVSKGDAYDVL